jgi:hypothetical protein
MKKRERLEKAIRAAVPVWCAEEFVWGTADCLLSLADIIKEARGYDPAMPFRGRYSTRIGALRVTREFGGYEGALEAMAHDAGWGEISPSSAKIGDIGIIKNARGAVGGVIKDAALWVGRKNYGFHTFPTEHIARAWRVR